MKKCSKCNSLKELSEFGRCASNSDGLLGRCRSCMKAEKAAYYQRHKEEIKARSREYLKNHREENRIACSKYYQQNKSRLLEEQREYRQQPEVIAYQQEYQQKYRKEHKDKRLEYQRTYRAKYPLAANLRDRIYSFVSGKTKSRSLTKSIGMSWSQLQKRFESLFYPRSMTGEPMTWKNYGPDGWHIDHIIPLCSFDLANPEQFARANHYTNLRPLWREDNQKKIGQDRRMSRKRK